jgi:hypothetical protein
LEYKLQAFTEPSSLEATALTLLRGDAYETETLRSPHGSTAYSLAIGPSRRSSPGVVCLAQVTYSLETSGVVPAMDGKVLAEGQRFEYKQ